MRQGRAAPVTEPGIRRILAPARAAILHTARLSQEPRPAVERADHTAGVVTGSADPEDSAMTADVAGILRNTSLLRSVPAPDLERVLAVSRMRTFRRGQVVFTRGDPGDTLIVVV